MLAVRARALLDGRLAPSIDDVLALAEPVLKHRMALTFAARAEGAHHSRRDQAAEDADRLMAADDQARPADEITAVRRADRRKPNARRVACRASCWRRAASPPP